MADKYKIHEDREAGMKYREIAEKHGVSYQYVATICGKYNPLRFHFITETGCVYPNLREWMNKNKVSKSEFLRRMSLEVCVANLRRLGGVMSGNQDPRKKYIDAMIGATGMTYETLFALEEDGG